MKPKGSNELHSNSFTSGGYRENVYWIPIDDLDKYAEDDDTSNREEFVAVQSFIDDLANDDVFVIATANNINVLPDSLLRAGRFDIKLRLNYPEENDSRLEYELHDILNLKNIAKSLHLDLDEI